jgi:hypothetical protein
MENDAATKGTMSDSKLVMPSFMATLTKAEFYARERSEGMVYMDEFGNDQGYKLVAFVTLKPNRVYFAVCRSHGMPSSWAHRDGGDDLFADDIVYLEGDNKLDREHWRFHSNCSPSGVRAAGEIHLDLLGAKLATFQLVEKRGIVFFRNDDPSWELTASERADWCHEAVEAYWDAWRKTRLTPADYEKLKEPRAKTARQGH